MFSTIVGTISEILTNSGFCQVQWQQLVMLLISMVLIYLAVAKGYEPLLHAAGKPSNGKPFLLQ